MKPSSLTYLDHPNNCNFFTIQINEQHANTIISLLVSHKIAFHIKYQPIQANDNPRNDLAQNTPNDSPPCQIQRFLQNNRAKIEKMYEEYVQKFPIEVIPKEEDIANSLGMNVSKFRTTFKDIYGKSFYQLFLEKRMEHAKLLLSKGLTCNEVARLVGYGNNSAIKFNKMFQRHFGITPKRYQVQYHH